MVCGVCGVSCVCVLCVWCACGVRVVCGVCGVCGSDDQEHAVSVQARSYMQLIGSSPPPLPRPDGGDQPWPFACAHALKNQASR